LRQPDQARAELETSVRLLPTADAYYALGTLAEQRGERTVALEHYGRAAQSQSGAGQAAQDATVRLDLPANPGNYLAARGVLDGNGQLVVEIGNPTRVRAADVQVVVRYADAQGAVREQSRRFAGELAPGQSARWATGLGPFTSTNAFQVAVAGARVLDN
jgi:tetratricopeptide (TPR) repeat protein